MPPSRCCRVRAAAIPWLFVHHSSLYKPGPFLTGRASWDLSSRQLHGCRATTMEGQWVRSQPPDFYAFVERLTGQGAVWKGEVNVLESPHEDMKIINAGAVKVSIEEVMRTCGGAVAGIDEQVTSDGATGALYGEHVHNRGEDSFTYFEDGSFCHAPALAAGSEMDAIFSIMGSDQLSRLRGRVSFTLAGQLKAVVWSHEERQGASPSKDEQPEEVTLRVRGDGSTWLRPRLKWERITGAQNAAPGPQVSRESLSIDLTHGHSKLLVEKEPGQLTVGLLPDRGAASTIE